MPVISERDFFNKLESNNISGLFFIFGEEKYLVKDCESEEENYKIESEFTKNQVIFDKLWYTINIPTIWFYSNINI